MRDVCHVYSHKHIPQFICLVCYTSLHTYNIELDADLYHTCIYVQVYIGVYISIYVHMYMHTFLHTNRQINRQT